MTTQPTRRTLLRAGGATAVLAVIGVRTGDLANAAVAQLPGSSARAAEAAVTGCTTLTTELTEGPFWVDERLLRSDVRSDSQTGTTMAGVPLTLTVHLTDAGADCTPQPGAYVDIWQCNAQGAYSAVSGSGNPDNTGVDWLRGYQVSDAEGKVTFTTIVPGWYVGRTLHIHFRVRLALDSSTPHNFTSQFFFDETTTAAVLATSAYQKSGTRTSNSTDGIYDASLVLPTSGSSAAGYTASYTVNLDFGDGAPDVTDDDTDSGTDDDADSTVAARIKDVRVVRRFGRRVVRVRVRNTERVMARVRIVRHDDVLAARRTGWLSPATRTLRLRIPDRVPAGRARVAVKVVDKAGNSTMLTRRIHLPRP